MCVCKTWLLIFTLVLDNHFVALTVNCVVYAFGFLSRPIT